MIRFFLSVVLLGLFTLAAYAASDQCAEAVSTVDIVECTHRERDQWDKRLNAAYKNLISTLDRQRSSELREIQRKWIAYRDAVCPFEVETGTMRLIMISGCFAEMTKARATQLEDMLNRLDE